MKISILTFPRAINYGTALQASALYTILKNLGQDVTFFKHDCAAVKSSNALFDFKHITDVKYDIAHLINLPAAAMRKRNFRKFSDKTMSFSDEDLSKYDVVVAGSDQIWNYKITGDDFFYFLDFKKISTKKVAYAASFGLSEIDRDYYPRLKDLLFDFDSISVREQTAANLVKDIAGIDVPVVLDPTFLLNKKQWENLASVSECTDKYIFVYTVFNSDSLWDFAYRLSKITGLKIKTISYSCMHRHNAEYCFTAGPDEWLRMMLDAEYVVTNSFHGMAFSINVEKQFFFEVPPSKSGVSSRLSDMATRYGLSSREISSADMTSVLDFTNVRSLLTSDISFSNQFIEQFLH